MYTCICLQPRMFSNREAASLALRVAARHTTQMPPTGGRAFEVLAVAGISEAIVRRRPRTSKANDLTPCVRFKPCRIHDRSGPPCPDGRARRSRAGRALPRRRSRAAFAPLARHWDVGRRSRATHRSGSGLAQKPCRENENRIGTAPAKSTVQRGGRGDRGRLRPREPAHGGRPTTSAAAGGGVEALRTHTECVRRSQRLCRSARRSRGL